MLYNVSKLTQNKNLVITSIPFYDSCYKGGFSCHSWLVLILYGQVYKEIFGRISSKLPLSKTHGLVLNSFHFGSQVLIVFKCIFQISINPFNTGDVGSDT